MKEFLSNSWVVSIISGILVFIVTNFFVIVKSKKELKKKIYDANTMVLNHIRGYIVDNGLPTPKTIEAIKNSVAREYSANCSDLLSNKEICEDLIKDIISNIYISNENRKKYINMLQDYLEQNISNSDSDKEVVAGEYNEKSYENVLTFISAIAGIFTIIGTKLSNYIIGIIEFDLINEVLLPITFLLIAIIGLKYAAKKK